MGQAATRSTRSSAWTLLPFLAFAWVALIFGVLAHLNRLEEDTPKPAYFDLFFSDTIHLKAWFASAAVLLALFQVFSAAWIFRKLPWPRPRWVNRAHRWSGRLAFLFTLPVAYHCIFLLGFQDATARTVSHSLIGSSIYGAFAAKVLIVRLHNFPRFVLPAAGGLLFGLLVAVWYTSAFWLFDSVGIGR